MASQSAELSASPAGRRVLGELSQLREDVDQHDDFVQQMTGALRLARFALGTSVLSVVANIILAFSVIGKGG